MKKIMGLMLLFTLLFGTVSNVFAATSVTSHVDITLSLPCTVVLEDSSGNIIEEKEVEDTYSFSLTHSAIGVYKYTVYQKFENTDTVTFDPTVWDVQVFVTRDGNTLTSAVITNKQGEEVKEEIKFKNSEKEVDVQISKKDITTSKEIIGATLRVTDSEGNVVEEWVTDGTPKTIKKLKPGKYFLTEITAPEGYLVAETVEFTVEPDDSIKLVEMFDDFTKVLISKKDFVTTDELPGARLILKNSAGEIVEEWTSTNEPHYIERLPVGVYTLIEITAPNGYEVAEEVIFEVKATGEIQRVEMFDKPISIKEEKPAFEIKKSVNKTSIEDGETVVYTVVAKAKNADVYEAVITDISEEGISVDKNSIKTNYEDAAISVDGHTITVSVDKLLVSKNLEITYSAKVEKKENKNTYDNTVTLDGKDKDGKKLDQEKDKARVTIKTKSLTATPPQKSKITQVKTGDTNKPLLWGGILGGSALLLVILFLIIKKKSKK